MNSFLFCFEPLVTRYRELPFPRVVAQVSKQAKSPIFPTCFDGGKKGGTCLLPPQSLGRRGGGGGGKGGVVGSYTFGFNTSGFNWPAVVLRSPDTADDSQAN